MKKIVIFVCGEVSKKCTANGCFRTFNEKSDSFAEYKNEETMADEDIQLVAFNTCPGCDQDPLDNLKSKLERLKKAETDTVHISTCIRGRCENYEEFANILAEAGFDVVGYTHGSRGGKLENTLWIKDGEKSRYKKSLEEN